MKKSFLLILFFSFLAISVIQAQKPHFFIECNQARGDTAQKYANAFARLVATEISEAFPCAKVNTQSDIVNKLDNLRFHYLMGDIEGDLPSFCDQLAHDFWIHLILIDYDAGRTMVVARCFKYKKVVCIADAGNIRCGNSLPEITEASKTITKRLIDKLSKFEICAFTGPMMLSIDSKYDTTTTEDYPVYCNMMDQTYHREESINKNVHSDWQLERKGIPWAGGDVNFKWNESSSLIVENGCYSCPSGRKGGRSYSRKNSFVIEGSGISNESIYKGKKQDDTRIEIEFLENGTYIITAKATSKPVQGEEKELEKAEGTCDNIAANPVSTPREITLPLKVVLGPFPGKSSDDILEQKSTITRRNPVSNEIETINYEFSLTKKMK